MLAKLAAYPLDCIIALCRKILSALHLEKSVYL